MPIAGKQLVFYSLACSDLLMQVNALADQTQWQVEEWVLGGCF